MRIVEIRSYEPRPKKSPWPVLIFIGIILFAAWKDSQNKRSDPALNQPDVLQDQAPTTLPVSGSDDNAR